FWGFLDVINPLQHIPVVNTIYREMTGDEIKAPAKMIGSAIIGGPVGLAVAMVDSAIEDTTGKDLGGHTMAMFRGDSEGENDNTTPDAATVASGANAMAAVQQSAATSARNFIPARLSAVSSARALPVSLLTVETKNDETREAAQSDQQTDAAIAAAAAAARMLAEETDPVMVPAWFDKTMMDAMGKYQAMQNAGS
ncbi:MAG: hypothetical protein ACPHGY_06370, partial [Rhodospirillaceae bacterium]